MPKIRSIATGEITEVSQTPVFVGGIWECGDQRFTDANGTEYEAVPLTPEELAAQLAKVKAEKCAALAAYRYGKEVSGLTLPNGMKIATDDRSKTLIAGAMIDATANPAILTDFKSNTGWVKIDATTVGVISAAVAGHVRACYSTERVHCEAVNALLTGEDVEAYDYTTGWPT